MMDEQTFEKAIKEGPDPQGAKLVFSDWLEEEGQAKRAKFLRESVALSTVPEFSEDQEAVIGRIREWMDDRDKNPYLTLGGYAGTGKSTIIRFLADLWPQCAVAALCGKAANVLRCKGVKRAQTIHSLVYEPIPNTRPVRFRRRGRLHTEDGRTVRRVIIDEASMVNEQILADLLSFDVPILFVGDHGQLEPIGRDAGLMKNPHLTLTKIHRQAEDNPIIRLSQAFRLGTPVPYWEDPGRRVSIVSKNQFWEILNPEVTMICAFNKTRHRINAACRAKLGFKGPIPVPGDRLVCLRNNSEHEIFNGQLAICMEVKERNGWELEMTVRADDDRVLTVPCAAGQFGKELLSPELAHLGTTLWDFGYGLTAHKAQGSEFDEVIVLDQYSPLWDAKRWRYTAATRAQSRLVYCL